MDRFNITTTRKSFTKLASHKINIFRRGRKGGGAHVRPHHTYSLSSVSIISIVCKLWLKQDNLPGTLPVVLTTGTSDVFHHPVDLCWSDQMVHGSNSGAGTDDNNELILARLRPEATVRVSTQ